MDGSAEQEAGSAQDRPAVDGDLVVGEDGLARPAWAATDPLLRRYYDHEWGSPVLDEQGMFERVSLEVFQSGLSWRVVLARRDGLRRAFHGFDPQAVAAMGQRQVERVLADPAVIRNRRKVLTTVANAAAVVAMRDRRCVPAPTWPEGARLDLLPPRPPQEGLAGLVWSHRPRATPCPRRASEVPTRSAESAALAAALKARGVAGVGPTTMYALMEAVGVVDTHLVGSHRRGSSGVWCRAGLTAAEGGHP